MALQKKPPVVTIMGHVDHGKTTLLDFIRKTRVAAREYGEITQAIGAYQIEFKGEKITFIDTPGHEAFSKMRSRGAQVADIVVLVISATDGVMPQTKESIKIIGETKVPFIVAISKTDLPQASVDKTKAQLAENEVFVEGYGGKVVALPVSAKTGEGVDQLLEMILLTAEMLDLKADPEGELNAVVIESKLDKFCGPVSTLVVRNGTLRKNEEIFIGGARMKVKMLKDEWGKPKEQAVPGEIALVLGFSSLPVVGEIGFSSFQKETTSLPPRASQEQAPVKKLEGVKPKIILKADVSGSLEAILGCLPSEVEIMASSVGEITESDVLLAKTLKAEIYGFNLSLPTGIFKLAEMEKVKVKNFRIIYDLLKDIEERILKILEPTIDRQVFGKAEILSTFEIRGEKIAGGRVQEGKINKSFPVLIQRGGTILGEAKITSMKQQKQDISEATVGMEFGAVLTPQLDFQNGDVLISFNLEEN